MTVLRIVGLCICAAGIVTVLFGAWLLRARMDKVRTWRTSQAEVLSSRSFIEPGSETDNCFSEFEIRYAVNGVPYQTRFKVWSSDSADAQARTARHPTGSRGNISYDPANPTTIDANLGMNPATLSLPISVIGGGIAGFLFGLAFVIIGAPSGNAGDLW